MIENLKKKYLGRLPVPNSGRNLGSYGDYFPLACSLATNCDYQARKKDGIKREKIRQKIFTICRALFWLFFGKLQLCIISKG